ncbi:hypothetical protein N119_01315 [Mycobacterium tuberculosis MAL020192]|nr:hypothetical protein N119_01315 [Mycobacterium tuberculosis MAL020192]
MTTSKIATAFKTATFALAAGAVALGLASPADAAAGTMYGDPAAAAKYWRQQTYDDCVLMSAADVIGQVTGREPSERAIIKVAQSTPSVVHPGSIYTKPADAEHPNSGMGTSVADIPTLLAHYGVDAVITDEDHATATGVATGMAALEQYLGSGHAVIVSINAEMIWGQPVEETDSADGNLRRGVGHQPRLHGRHHLNRARMSITTAGSHSLQEHRVGCPPIACLDEHQQDSRGTFTIIFTGPAFHPHGNSRCRCQGPPTRYIARRAEILGSYRIGETWYHNDR